MAPQSLQVPAPQFGRSPPEAGPSGREQPEADSRSLWCALLARAVVRQTVQVLHEAVTAGSGTVLLTGKPGTGKTTIVKQLALELHAGACTVVGFNCADLRGSDGFVRLLSDDLGIAHPGGRIDRWLKLVHHLAAKLNKSGAPLVLVIDGAERLGHAGRSLLGQLLNTGAGPSGLRLVLAGRPQILGHAELQPDHDLGRSIRVDHRLEWQIGKDLTGSFAASRERADRFEHEISTEVPSFDAASDPPSERTQAARTSSATAEHFTRWAMPRRPRTEPSLRPRARSTERVRAACFGAAVCVAAGGIGFAAVVGGWLAAETSQSSTNSPAGHERVEEAVSSDVRWVSATPIGDPVAVGQNESRLVPRWLQLLVGWEPTGKIDNELADAVSQPLGLAGKAAQDQKVREETSKASKAILRQPRLPSTPPPTSTRPEDASRLASTLPAPWEQGLARVDATSAGTHSNAALTTAPKTASIGGATGTAQSGTESATNIVQPGKGGWSGAVRLPDHTVAALLRRGDELLALGDLSAARLLYERAAMGGSARAATAAGKTYDPIFVKDSGLRGARPDTAKALAWYGKAIELGDGEAAARLKRLSSFPQP